MPAASIAEVVELLRTWGPERYDEEVSQLDHALQSAALARAEGASDELVAAALLHDVGHLLELREGGVADGDVAVDLGHEARGARWLAAVLPPAVTGPIALHVAAKRYRCATEDGYEAALSAGSTASLARQGGPMSPAEAERFAAHPASDDAVRLRGWDDAGKVTDLDVGTLDDHLELLARVATA
ncbi:MAG: hypothetical protein KDA97_13295 [Acidimicrobiales bacterium]|nr:hypothetical protein [Acidimicrobiales bacterium]